jgi:cytochrome c556
MKRVGMWCVLATAALVCLTSGGAAPRNQLSDFMRVKLKHSQLVIEGLVLADFDKIAKNSQDMSLLSLAETWQVLQTPQYIAYSRKFRNATDALSDAAKKKDLDKATEAYNLVTTRCVECHKYVRDVRMARLD